MTRLRLTLSLSGLGIALMGVVQKNDYLIRIAIGLLMLSVLLRIVEGIRRRRAESAEPGRSPADPTA